ncbi:hypothetical protein AHAS_Ahas07G0152400 [Arachis hypogaea]
MACHVFDTKWHVHVFWPPLFSLKTYTSEPRLEAGVPRPSSCLGSSSWRATPSIQVARQS